MKIYVIYEITKPVVFVVRGHETEIVSEPEAVFALTQLHGWHNVEIINMPMICVELHREYGSIFDKPAKKAMFAALNRKFNSWVHNSHESEYAKCVYALMKQTITDFEGELSEDCG